MPNVPPPRRPRSYRRARTRLAPCPRIGAPDIRAASALLAAVAGIAMSGAAPAGAADAVADAIAEGDAHYERRAEGARGGTADPKQAHLAIQAYPPPLSPSPAHLSPPSRP